MKTSVKDIRFSGSILFISALDFWSLGKGKGGPALWRTLTGYVNRGWEVHFITGNRPVGKFNEIPYNINVIRFDAPWLKRLFLVKKLGFFAKILWWIYFQIMAFYKAYKLYLKANIDVVYGYEIHAVPVVKILSRLWNVPMVARYQGSILRLVWMKKLFWKVRAWEYFLAYKMSPSSDLVIMTNDGSQGDKLMAQFGVSDERLRFWVNGLDKEHFENLPNTDEACKYLNIYHRHVLLSVSRLIDLKRVDRSIQALSDVLKDYPDTLLLIVGDGNEREKLKQLADELGVREYVRFEGAVLHSEIPKYLAAADIFLSFYDWTNVGNPLLEAMMAGKCIVTLDNGDTGRFIRNGENGILLSYNDLPKLPEVIKNLLANETLRKQLGVNARSFAEKNFWSWEERIEAEVREVSRFVGA